MLHARRCWSLLLPLLFAFGFPLLTASNVPAQAAPAPGQLLISEFRFRGPSPSFTPPPQAAANNEFIEIYNNSEQPYVVQSTDGSSGWSVAAPDVSGGGSPFIVLFTIPNNTTIAARGHYLATNSNGYTLGGYAIGDVTYAVDLPDDGGIAIFSTSDPANFNLDTRIDAVGYNPPPEFNGSPETTIRPLANTPLFLEGNGLSAFVTTDNEHSFLRNLRNGPPLDTDNNVEDFILVSTDPASFDGAAILGAPGPENLASPVRSNGVIKTLLIDPQCSGFGPATSACRFVRDQTPVTNGTRGTLAIRRSFTNTTAQAVTRLRFRVVDITTLSNRDETQADLRTLTNPVDNVVVTRQDSTPETLRALTLAEPPSQPSGGGVNSTLNANSITLDSPLLPNEELNLEFLLGVVENGNFRFFVNVEADFGALPSQVVPGGSTTRARAHRQTLKDRAATRPKG